jgi:hypothetical protein
VRLVALAIGAIAAVACAAPPAHVAPTPVPAAVVQGVAVTRVPATAVPTAVVCAASTPTTEPLPAVHLTPVGRDPVGAAWTGYRSSDRLIWVSNLPTHAGGSHKVLWLKPPGSVLRVTGRRLDGEAPPLIANLPEGYGGDFQASGIGFPTAGCWEVEARADASVLRFVVAVQG